jgi:beta-RFAP synthase
MTAGAGTRVIVEAPARLHFGVLDLRGDRGRRFGGIGAAVPEPGVAISAAVADRIQVEGPDAERASEFARRFAAHYGLPGAQLRVIRAIPAHSGLGSGTQLALTVAKAMAHLYGVNATPAEHAAIVGRGHRSAVGTWAFALGGFILEGGRTPGSEAVAPLLSRLPIPEDWRCVIAVPQGSPGLSGEAEAAAFARLPPPEAREVEHVAHLVLMQLMPALVDGDLRGFGAALTEIQRITGGWFRAIQGGAFAQGDSSELVRRLAEWGAAGVGQSSWGPAVYGIVRGEDQAGELARLARGFLRDSGSVFQGGFSNTGARTLGPSQL